MKEGEGQPVVEKQKKFVCEVCGLDKPVDEVFQCTFCLKEFCVEHAGLWAHNCYANEPYENRGMG